MRESTVLLSNQVGAGILTLPGAGGDTGLRLPARIACCVDGTAPEAGVALHVGLSPCVCGVRVCVCVCECGRLGTFHFCSVRRLELLRGFGAFSAEKPFSAVCSIKEETVLTTDSLVNRNYSPFLEKFVLDNYLTPTPFIAQKHGLQTVPR